MVEKANIQALSRIHSVSETLVSVESDANAVVMVGSFAPIHRGHFDAVRAAVVALQGRGRTVASVVMTPNSKQYLRNKLKDNDGGWTYKRRIQEILRQEPILEIPTFVDDISGRLAKAEQINNYVPETVRQQLGFNACQQYLVVGSDQLPSMESHLDNTDNRAVCVLRPGNLERLQEDLSLPWVNEAIESGRFIVTERDDMITDISSTMIRQTFMAQ